MRLLEVLKQSKTIYFVREINYNTFEGEGIEFLLSSNSEVYYKIRHILFSDGNEIFVKEKTEYLEECKDKKFSFKDIVSKRKQYGINDSVEICNKLFN